MQLYANFLLVSVAASLLQVVVDGYSIGAKCGPAPSVGGDHLQASSTKTVENYQWDTSSKPVALKLGDDFIDVGGSLTIKAKTLTEIKVVGLDGNNGTRGVLFRLEADRIYDPNGNILKGAALPGESTKTAKSCKLPVVGVTHIAANEKPEVSAILNLPNKVGTIILSVTVVFSNSATVSEYTYALFSINVIGCKESVIYSSFINKFLRRNGKKVCTFS